MLTVGDSVDERWNRKLGCSEIERNVIVIDVSIDCFDSDTAYV